MLQIFYQINFRKIISTTFLSFMVTNFWLIFTDEWNSVLETAFFDHFSIRPSIPLYFRTFVCPFVRPFCPKLMVNVTNSKALVPRESS